MVRQYNEDIELAASEIDSFGGKEYERLMNEWKKLKVFVKEMRSNKKDPQYKEKLHEYRKKYLNEIIKYKYGDPEYEYYKILLEFIGIDEYLYASTLEKYDIKGKKV